MSAPLSSSPAQAARPFVSVIIAVYNDQAGILRCVTALESQTYPGDRYEIIVVDHASLPPIALDPERFPHVRMTREARPGVSRARVTGMEMARGELLAITDADCLPAADWLASGVERLLGPPDCGLVAGRIEVVARNPARPNVPESLGIAMHLKQERFLRGGWCVLANAFTSRRVLDTVGALNTRLLCSGDEEWGRRVHDAGFRQVYAADVCVQHPARATVRQLCLRTIRLEFGWKEIREETGMGRGLRTWLGQYVYHPLLNIYVDIARNPGLGTVRKIQVAGLAGLLIAVRLGAWALLGLGLPFDVRKNWG